MASRTFAVYILASHSRRLYIGVTNDLLRRVFEHRSGRVPGFTARYHVTRLVYFEQTSNVRSAIAREKQLKGWSREKKTRLIESVNAGWLDLAEGWLPGGPSGVAAVLSSRAERGIVPRNGSSPAE